MIYSKNSKVKFFLINYIICFSCVLISIIILFYNDYNGYELLFLQPLIFGIAFILVYSKIIINNKPRLFFIVFTSVAFIRYVIVPLLIVVSRYYGGRSYVEPVSNSFHKAILLMIYELIICTIYIAINEKRNHYNNYCIKDKFDTHQLEVSKNNIGYVIFFIITLLGILMYPSVLLSINFIVPNSLSDLIEYNLVQNIVIYCVVISKQLLFVILIKRLYRKYLLKVKERYILISFLLGLLNTFIYFGTNRTDIVISAIVSLLLIYKLYGKATKKYFIFGLVLLILLIKLITDAREIISISGGNNYLVDITDTLEVYTGSIYNVSIAIETKQYFPEANDLSVLFFDIFRPMIGINLIIKNLPFNYSNIFFNKRIWLDIDRRSQILPMIGQGNLFFGFIFSPIFSIIFIKFYYIFEKKIRKTKNLEIFYFVNLIIVRLGFFMGQNTMNLINDMSINLVLFLAVYYFNKFINNLTNKFIIQGEQNEFN